MDNCIKGSYINIKGFHIPENELSRDQIKLIKTQLTVEPTGLNYADGDLVRYELFKHKNGYYTVPRYWGIENICNPEKVKFKNDKAKINFTGDLRQYQEDIVNKCYDHMTEDGGGLISVGCGSGKTVMALNLACKLKVKTLVIVHKTFLQEQWIERIEQFTNARIGIIRRDKVDVEDKDIVIGSIQSIAKRNYGTKVFKKFGFVIYDEAHHVSSKHFSKCLMKTCCKYTLALTATPYRLDGLIKVMYWFLGECIYKQSEKINKNVIVKKILFNSHDTVLFTEKKSFVKGKGMLPSTVKMISNILEIDTRTGMQVDIIDRIIRQDSKRKILILSGRKSHIKELKERFDISLMDAINDGIIEDEEITTCYFHGDLSKEEREFSGRNGDVIFGTYEMAQEALDIPRLNTVLFFTPKKDIKQAVGRILRKILKQGDTRPLVVDFIDDLSVFKNHGDVRSKFYKKVKYTEEEYYAFDQKMCTYKEYMKHKGITLDDKYDKNVETDMSKIFNIPEITLDDLKDAYDESSDESSEDSKPKFSHNMFLK